MRLNDPRQRNGEHPIETKEKMYKDRDIYICCQQC